MTLDEKVKLPNCIYCSNTGCSICHVRTLNQQAQRIAELEAHCHRLKEFTDASCEDAFSDEWIARQHDAQLETPVQSLAHIKAEAVEEVLQSLVDSSVGGEDDTDFPVRVYHHLKNYANNLRNT